jgi:hypothetical protein
MYIPKNTALILNCYEIHHNEERYPDPYASTFLSSRSRSKLRTYCNRFVFNPDRFLGDTLTSDESSKLPNAMDRDHWAFGAGYVPKPFLPCLILRTSSLTPLLPSCFVCVAVVVSAQVFTLQNGRCGLRSRVYSGSMRSDPYPTSLFPWRNTMASMDARRCRIVSPSHRDVTEFIRCWRRSRKSL